MASIAPYNGVLGHRLSMHLLRRATYIQNKASIDAFAAKTATQAVDDLFEISDHIEPEPIDRGNLERFINQGIEPTSGNSVLRSAIAAWWVEEALHDNSIGHKLEFFLHSILITNANSGQPRQVFDYLNLFQLTSSRYENGNFEMDSFQNLALKIITDNVMLVYLNGRDNTEDSPNENFAREFFELFTIGKGPQIGPGDYTTYTEDDIVEASKLLTGWINRNRPLGQGGDPLYTDPDTGIQRGDTIFSRHDTTDKTFSSAFGGLTISGAEDEEDMWRELKEFVDMIFSQNATAVNIAKKIYRYFVGPKITPEIQSDIIDELAATLADNNYKISLAIKQLLKSQHFYDLDDSDASDEIIGSQLKSPVELLLQTMSFFDITTPDFLSDTDNHYRRWYQLTFQQIITTQAGMPFFYPDSVAGYPAYYQEPGFSRNWFNGATLISRYKQPEILLTGNRILASGTNGGVQLDIVDFVANSGVCTDPSDAESLVNDLTHYLFAETPIQDRSTYFLEVFLDDLSPINWWFEWNHYIDSGDDTSVVIPLQTLFKALLSSQEYGLM